MVRKRSDFHAARHLRGLEDLPNVGPAIAGDLRRIGIERPQQLRRRNPYALYARLNSVTAVRHDPCVLDAFISAVRFVDGGPALPWWKYTAERKKALARGRPRRGR
jgi:DNA transformation protein